VRLFKLIATNGNIEWVITNDLEQDWAQVIQDERQDLLNDYLRAELRYPRILALQLANQAIVLYKLNSHQ